MKNLRRAVALKERKRRQWWEGGLILTAVVGLSLFAFSQARLPQLSDTNDLASNVLFVFLVNLNIILLVLLVFLVGRNLIKLFYERRRNLLGSHLRFRLVSAFVIISLFPAVLLFLVGVGFLTRSIDNWFASQVEESLEDSLAVVSVYYDHLADEATRASQVLATEIAEGGLLDRKRKRALQNIVEERRRVFDLERIEVLSGTRELVSAAARGESASAGESEAEDALGAIIGQVLNGEPLRQLRSAESAHLLYGGAPILVKGEIVGAVITSHRVPEKIAQQSTQVVGAFREYRHLKVLKQPIKSNYLITMFLVTLVAVFSAVWLGLFLAKKISIPLQQLAEGTRAVARGHWQHRIEGEGEDEIGTLVAAFNRMTEDLQHSHLELESRRRSMEILLANINAGVVALDRDGVVTTVNRAAERLVGIDSATSLGRDYREVFAAAEFGEVRRVARDLLSIQPGDAENGAGESQGQLRLNREGQTLSLLMTGTALTDDRQEVQGIVCFFEDVTQIIRVERMEAWREVARRIAHEIKNPLTPIQLAAERLQRRFAPQIGEHRAVFDECVHSIAQEVEAIKRLVNEFSTFARLPMADHRPEDLNALVQETLALFDTAHKDMEFVWRPDRTLPALELDREGIKRVVRNLLDNAVAACREVANGVPGRIEVTTHYFRPLGIARLEVADNGCGIPPEVRDRLFEPYFSTKKEGTGLGLAIVATVVADHQAFIRVRENQPRGSRFMIELPVRRSQVRGALSTDPATVPLNGMG
ncbi:MAG: HAMP domain-containing protein [Deltaproteobacteria bacterium]|nr:HAMP domain-containing protein [Deltaproteobacteria bacterium]